MKRPKTKTTEVKVRFGRRTYRVPVTSHWNAAVGRYAMHTLEWRASELALAVQLAEKSPVDGAAFQWMRKVLQLSGAELGELLGVRLETISRWERGDVPVTRSAWLWLCGAVLERAGKRANLIEVARARAAD
jgi:DNA-binding transcriptional regulator YiaG